MPILFCIILYIYSSPLKYGSSSILHMPLINLFQMFAFTSTRRNPSIESEVNLVYNNRNFKYKDESERYY